MKLRECLRKILSVWPNPDLLGRGVHGPVRRYSIWSYPKREFVDVKCPTWTLELTLKFLSVERWTLNVTSTYRIGDKTSSWCRLCRANDFVHVISGRYRSHRLSTPKIRFIVPMVTFCFHSPTIRDRFSKSPFPHLSIPGVSNDKSHPCPSYIMKLPLKRMWAKEHPVGVNRWALNVERLIFYLNGSDSYLEVFHVQVHPKPPRVPHASHETTVAVITFPPSLAFQTTFPVPSTTLIPPRADIWENLALLAWSPILSAGVSHRVFPTCGPEICVT